jgi:2-polyprenyl-3-methyl-5-hydroxy-6-metoxy-1,4-benzoquinol methylase
LDIDAEAVAFVKQETGLDNVCVADLAEAAPDRLLAAPAWDLLVAGEIVEHLDNPVDFLSRVNRNLRHHCREIVVTVPNAFSLQNFLGARRHEERINSDHRFWFTPYTLAKILTRSGYRPATFEYVNHNRFVAGGIRSWFRLQALRRYPGLRQTLIMSAHWA